MFKLTKTIFLLLFLHMTAAAGVKCRCGQVKRREFGVPKEELRIVGGAETEVGEYPWQVNDTVFLFSLDCIDCIFCFRQVKIIFNNMFYCGGSLLNSLWVLTAGHCLTSGGQNIKPQFLEVVFGDHNRNLTVESREHKFRVVETQTYPGFNMKELLVNDFGLLKLSEEVSFADNPNIRPVCLPKAAPRDHYVGRRAMTTGWGKGHNHLLCHY